MTNPNFDFLRSKFNIDQETFTLLTKLAIKKVIKRGETTFKQGGMSTKVHFLVSGLMRATLAVESGKELTKNIYSPKSFVTPFTSILKRQPSLLSYETLTDCEIFEVDFGDFLKLTQVNIKISNLYNRVLEYVFMIYEQKQLDTMSLNAAERYELLKKQIPNIDNLIAQYHIASYLNITPVQLSRIRKGL